MVGSCPGGSLVRSVAEEAEDWFTLKVQRPLFIWGSQSNREELMQATPPYVVSSPMQDFKTDPMPRRWWLHLCDLRRKVLGHLSRGNVDLCCNARLPRPWLHCECAAEPHILSASVCLIQLCSTNVTRTSAFWSAFALNATPNTHHGKYPAAEGRLD